jgi:hypothetical protein
MTPSAPTALSTALKRWHGRKAGTTMAAMGYEQYLDEVTTLIYEHYDLSEEAAIQMVMRAQADDFFSGHDDDPSICTLERANEDAKAVFKRYK